MSQSIQDILQLIANAVYGREVRGAIHDGIEMCYDDVTESKTVAEAAAETANTAASAANTAAVAAENATAAANVAIASIDQTAVSAIKRNLIKYNCADLFDGLEHTSSSQAGITYTWNGNTCTITGTQTGTTVCDISGDSTTLPSGMVPGETYHLIHQDELVGIRLVCYYSDNTSETVFTTYEDKTFTLPSNAVAARLRFFIANGTNTINKTLTPMLMTTMSNRELAKYAPPVLTLTGTTLSFES